MLDVKTVRKKVLLRLLGHPLVLLPCLAGLSVLTAAWATGWRIGIGLFAGLAGLLASAGALVTKIILDNGQTARTVIQEMEVEGQRARQAALDELDRRLVQADQDPRPETALRDLRALLTAFDDAASQADSINLATILEVRSKVHELFDQSVRSIEHTLKLGDTAKRLLTPTARQPILDQREKIIDDVEAGIRQLGKTLAALQGGPAGGVTGSDLAQLRDELDQSLEVANRVEARLQTLLDPTASDIRNQPIRNQEKG